MKFPSEKRMKNRELLVNVYPDLKTKKNNLILVDVSLNVNFLYADEDYEELHVFKRPYKDSYGKIDYMHEALYLESEIEAIKEIAEDNFYEVLDDDGKLSSIIYGIKGDLIYSKLLNTNFVKVDVNFIKKSSTKVDESLLCEQYNYNVDLDDSTFNEKALDDMLDYDLTLSKLKSFSH